MSNADLALSVLMADVSGSVRLHEKLGDAEASRAIERCLKRMERAVEVFGGRLVKALGDQLMAVFDLPDQAFQAALEIQERIADLPPVSGVKLAVRIGFSHGPVDGEQDHVIGEAVNDAAYLTGLAKPGQVLTCLQAQSLLSDVLKQFTRDVGSVPTAGKFTGINLFELFSPREEIPRVPLTLRYGDELLILDENRVLIKMGRDAQSDIEIHDRRASRQHARIERRGNRVVLVDNSSNGTYVTLNGEPELFLHDAECVIHGKGLICFAASASSTGADCAEFG